MDSQHHPLHKLFYPEHIAVIGAGDDLTTVNGRSLMLILRHETKAKVYPVNPKRDQVQGLTCYHSVADLPVVPDVAVLVIAQRFVAETLTALGERGCPFAVVTASGYAEAGEEGKKEQQQIIDIAKRYGMHLVGPNCVGVVNLNGPVVLSWVSTLTRQKGELLYGDVAMVSQSGAMLSSLWDRAIDYGLGYSKVISSGNERRTSAWPNTWSIWPWTRKPRSSAPTSRESRTRTGWSSPWSFSGSAGRSWLPSRWARPRRPAAPPRPTRAP